MSVLFEGMEHMTLILEENNKSQDSTRSSLLTLIEILVGLFRTSESFDVCVMFLSIRTVNVLLGHSRSNCDNYERMSSLLVMSEIFV